MKLVVEQLERAVYLVVKVKVGIPDTQIKRVDEEYGSLDCLVSQEADYNFDLKAPSFSEYGVKLLNTEIVWYLLAIYKKAKSLVKRLCGQFCGLFGQFVGY